jgi:hypothetical protein
MTNRGFIKYVTRRLRKMLRGEVKIEVRRSDVWNEKGYKRKWHVNAFTLWIWKGHDRNATGICIESADAEYMMEYAFDCLATPYYANWHNPKR